MNTEAQFMCSLKVQSIDGTLEVIFLRAIAQPLLAVVINDFTNPLRVHHFISFFTHTKQKGAILPTVESILCEKVQHLTIMKFVIKIIRTIRNVLITMSFILDGFL